MKRSLNDKEQIKEMTALISNPYYDVFRPTLRKFLGLSRNKKFMSVPTNHLALQLAILLAIEEGDEAVSKGRALISPEDDGQHLQNMRNKFLSLAFRMIADGIAWRTLDYNRFHIRVLSQARSPGPAWKKDGRNAETSMAKNVAENLGHFVIVNDATNLIRVGDLIYVNPERNPIQPVIAEMKKNKMIMFSTIGKKIEKRTMALSKQEKRLFQAQLAIMKNEVTWGKKTAPVLYIQPSSIRDKLRKVNNMLVVANKNGSSEGFLTPYMYFSAIDLTFFTSETPPPENEKTTAPQDLKPIAFWTNYGTLAIYEEGEVPRSTAPYSVFPFSMANVIKMMLGEMYIQVIVYRDPLVKAFNELGWDLVINDDTFEKYGGTDSAETIAYFSNEQLFPEGGFKEGDFMMLVNPKNGFKWPIYQMINQMLHEFTTVEYIVAQVEEIMRASKPGKINGFFVENSYDKQRWR